MHMTWHAYMHVVAVVVAVAVAVVVIVVVVVVVLSGDRYQQCGYVFWALLDRLLFRADICTASKSKTRF